MNPKPIQEATYPVCPFCGSSEVRKSRGHGIFGRVVPRAIFRRAYRCDISTSVSMAVATKRRPHLPHATDE